MAQNPTDTPTSTNPARAILDTLPRHHADTYLLAPGCEPGHRYSYRLGNRCGTAYAHQDGTWTSKPNGGLPDTFLASHQHQVEHLTHAPYSCAACGGPGA